MEGPPVTSKTSKRVQVDLPINSVERLDALLERTQGTTKSLFLNALQLYEFVVQEHSQGSKVFIEDAQGNRKELMLFI